MKLANTVPARYIKYQIECARQVYLFNLQTNNTFNTILGR